MASFPEDSQTWEYDPVLNTWNTTRANIPVGMGGSATSIAGQFIYLVGTWNNSAASNVHYRYDITGNTWTAMAVAPAPVYEAAGAAIGGQTYVIGGGNPSSPQNSTYVYDIASNTWSTGPNLNVARSFTAGTAIGARLLVVGGGIGGPPPFVTDTVEMTQGACGTPPPTATPGGTPTPTPTPTLTVTPTPTVTPTATPPCVRFVITLNGAQEVPPNGSAGSGTGIIDVNTVTNELFYNITFSGLGSAEQMAHIHGFAPPGMNAGIIHNLPLGSPKIGVFNYSQAQEADILNGLSYVNIHTVNFGNGEIRGQIAGPMGSCPTPTPTPTATPTPTPSPTVTPSTPTPTPTPTPATPTPTPSSTATPTPTPTPTATPAAQAINLSTRMRVQTGDNVGVGGLIITGSSTKHVLIRAIGPSLTQFGVPNVLADPVLELHGPGTFVTVTNNNWRDDPVQEAVIVATGIPPTDDLESAIDATLDPGAYTAIVRGNSNTSGVALVEVYDLNAEAASKLANISTRAFVSTGDNIVIAGFMLGGNSGDDRIVVRGIGPSLTAVGVPNALADPTLELRDSNGALLIANNDWQDDPAQAAELTAAGLAPTNQLESGIVATLPPGPYTALLAGLNNGTGIGLVEVYDRGAP